MVKYKTNGATGDNNNNDDGTSPAVAKKTIRYLVEKENTRNDPRFWYLFCRSK